MCMSDFSSCELLALANLFAIKINNEFFSEDTLLFATFFTVLGDTLALLATKKNKD